jgi:hypothetical protein
MVISVYIFVIYVNHQYFLYVFHITVHEFVPHRVKGGGRIKVVILQCVCTLLVFSSSSATKTTSTLLLL